MPIRFQKKVKCGCIVIAMTCGKENSRFLLGGHRFHLICTSCKQNQKNTDTLDDMFENDNYTDGLEKDGWKNSG